MAATVETISKGPKVTRHAWKDLGTHYKKVKKYTYASSSQMIQSGACA